jgi:hypothetical protein
MAAKYGMNLLNQHYSLMSTGDVGIVTVNGKAAITPACNLPFTEMSWVVRCLAFELQRLYIAIFRYVKL